MARRHPYDDSGMTCGNGNGARTVCRDPSCWCWLEGGARAVANSPLQSWPRVGIDALCELFNRGYSDRSIVDVQLPD